MSKIKTLAGSALVAAVAVGGLATTAGSAAAAEAPAKDKKKSAVGPYECATAVPLLSDDMLLASAYLSCTEQEEANEETNVHYESRMLGLELPDKKGPAVGVNILPKAVQDDEEQPPGEDGGSTDDGSTDGSTGETDDGNNGGGNDDPSNPAPDGGSPGDGGGDGGELPIPGV